MIAPDALLAAQDRKFAALVKSDVDALEELLADTLVYTHANGRVDDKASLIEGVANQGYLSVTRRTEQVRLLGAVGLITGQVDIAVHEKLRFDGRFTDVWVYRDGWKNFAWQSTIIPPAA